ncbi:C25 family cysteine peptidase [Chryseolinea sp. H1M3-3]|uniref:putative type IX secretion system sortase PorU2 n=1 Tax=Chryseolinea sp. H1M3-3 TaxID=3034144 RepID=UPI0023ED288E|nr:C25 family cysteine peptidase [Chryseolinea sp. H1M3-3]
MRPSLFVLILIIVSLKSVAQVGNEWIDFNQVYFKIPVAKEGIYRLNFADLQAAGFPVNTNPKRIQLFHRGIEQAIFVEGEDDTQFDPTDFIEFYGQKNDGTLDAGLYKPASSQPHSYYNLFSDTTSYFLTVGPMNGKRISPFYEENTGNLSAETYHWDEKLLLWNNDYATGIDYGEILNTFFDVGEGWMSHRIFQTQFLDNTLSDIINTVPAAALPELEILLIGRGVMAHQVELFVGSGLRLVATHNFSGFEPQKIVLPLQWSDIAGDGKLTVRVKVNGQGGQPDRVSIGYIKLKYPQNFDGTGFTEKSFLLQENINGKSFIKIINPAAGLRLFDVTDPNSVVRIDGVVGSTIDAIVPSTETVRRIFASSATITPAIKAVNFRQIIPSQHDYIIVAHPLLQQPALGYSNPVKAYAEYRASAEGGGYDTLIVNIQQLYDQFNYGEPSPLAIYHFVKFLTNANVPKYLLLVGKGLDVNYKYFRNPAGFPTFKNLIPAAGYPGSDMAYSAGLAGTQYEPAIPTGRIPATKAEEVAAYLNKVKEMEALPFDNLWRKNLLHLSGGREEGEPELLQSYLTDLQSVAEDKYLGGKVSALAKYSKEIQVVNVSKQVNEGVNLITFFGHSSATNLDFDIGYVTNPVMGYNNKGKYPTLLMNGCNVGAYFLTYTTFGEDWVLARDKGATAFIAHSSYGFTNLLKRYADHFYEVGYQDSSFIYKGIGDIQKEAARRYMSTTVDSPPNTTQVQQMILLGDPAVKLFGAPKADLEINNDNVSVESLDGLPITALTESFGLKLIVRNFGQAKPDTIRVEVTRLLNDNSVIVYDSLYPVTKYSDTLMFIINKGREEGFGTNSFTVKIDPDNVLPELSKSNNSVTKDFVIPLNGTKNLYPTNFGIVNANEIALSFQTSNLLSEERNFILELDTVNTFDSPWKQEFPVKGTILVRQTVSLLASDTLAYYWRTRLVDPLPEESTEWTQSSFTYINNGPEGWAQVHFPQYLQDQTVGLVNDEYARRITFKETITDVNIRTYGANHPSLNTDVSIKINNEEYNLTQQGFICRDNSINLIAFDKNSAAPYIGVKFKWYNRGNRACGREPWVINNYVPGDMVTGNEFDIIQFVNNVQEGDSVVLFNIGDAQYSAWPAAAKTKLGELGISVAQIDGLLPGEPIVIFAKKGLAPGGARIYKTSASPSDAQELSVSKTVTGRYSSGSMISGLIGPALNWQSLSSRSSEVEQDDIIAFDLIGVKLNGEEQFLLSDVIGEQDLSGIDANEFPYVKVMFKVTDDANLTAPQVNNWIVAFTPVPDGLLSFKGAIEQQVLIEGENWIGEYDFVNITDKTFPDSLTVNTEVFNQTARTSQLGEIKIKAPLPGDTTKFYLEVNTINKGGLNDLNVYVNPKIIPEQYYDNNILQLHNHLLVEEEKIHPVLDVSIDGRYIENKEFVTSNPLILIKVWDENQHILITDTTGVKIYLTYPCESQVCEPTPIFFNRQDITWFPATGNLPFRVELRPANLSNGVYTLRVEARDGRNNSSGTVPFEIQFTVNSENAIKIADPYPNPFTNELYFKIVISGNELPDAFDWQVINVNGKVVAHYGNYSAPGFHIGTNELSWDGKDQQGNVLSNGVYIYKMMLYTKDRFIEKKGKVVLMRRP